ncbi:MAG: TRAP transporter large permease [Pseudomonadales bacterium]
MFYFILSMTAIVAMLLAEIPVAFAFGLGALLFALLTESNISFLMAHGFLTSSGFALLALPLFIMAGTLMGRGGITERLLNFINAFVGRTKGGLGAVTVLACALFGAISGSATSAIAAIGQIMVPRMVREGYPEGHATALVACSSVLAIMIPPSIPMIVFAIAGGISVGAAFLSTLVPGIMLTIIYCLLNFVFLRNNQTIKVAPKQPFKATMKEVSTTGSQAVFSLLMPLIILGGIYSGIFTPTEAAAVAVVYSAVIALYVYRGMTLSGLYDAIVSSAVIAGSIMAVLFFLFIMSRTMVLEQIPNQLADILISISDNKWVVLLMINLLLLLIGMIVDDVSGGILAAVIFMPVIRELGVDPVHFAAIVGTNLGLGNISPPCAPLLYMAGAINKLSLDRYLKPTLKFLLLGHLPMVFIVTYFPQVSLFLPELVLGKL